MKLRYLFILALFTAFTFSSCKKEAEKVEKQEAPQELAQAKLETVSLNISGMSCEIGCAKTIQSKLVKKEGVLEAKVVFTDSIATIKFDANKTNKKDLIAFVDGIAGGDLYKASETMKKAHKCDENCKKECDMMTTKTCDKDCKMECCKDKKKA